MYQEEIFFSRLLFQGQCAIMELCISRLHAGIYEVNEYAEKSTDDRCVMLVCGIAVYKYADIKCQC